MRQAWVTAVTTLGGRADIAEAGAGELAERYGQAHRRYHTAEHVQAVLEHARWLAGELGLTAHEQALLAAAVCAHDVVYDGVAGADEQASADWARAQLTAGGVRAGVAGRVAELVLATADHEPGGDRVTAVLLDADLAILGSPAPAYHRYAGAVRAEYASVPDELWRAGRTRVLTALLERDPLYATEPGRRRWQGLARANLAAEIATLTDPGHQPA